MAIDETLVGEVCHIKGKKPDAARYDPAQTPAARNDYDNLILLCAPHHKVIDDDEEAYTVERLRKMKADHEARAMTVSDGEASQVAAAYSTVATIGQSGGIAAHNFTARDVTFQTGQPADPVSKRQLDAVENLWGILKTLRKEFGTIIFIDMILIASEMKDYFRSGQNRQVMDAVGEYADPQCAVRKIASVNPDKERPFVSHRIWSIVFGLIAIYGRSALLITNSYHDKDYRDWRLDPGTDQLLRALFPASLAETLKKKPHGGLSAAIDYLESQFLAEAGLQK
jgi:hypothetical protein